MMLKINRNPTFKTPVKVFVPVDNGQAEQTFTAEFRALTRSEMATVDAVSAEGADEFLHRVVVGWEGVVDGDGDEFAFSPQNLETMIDIPFVRQALCAAYFSATSGVKAAKRGN
jgi:hypothetical protein